MRFRWLIILLGLLASVPAGRPVSASAPLVALTGRLFDDQNGNQVYDNEPCVNGVVSLISSATGKGSSYQVFCGQTPFFFFRGLTPGNYILSVQSTSPPDYTLPSFPITISAGSQATVQRDLPVRRRIQRISGSVIQDRNGNRQLDAGEPPLAAIRVDLLNAATGSLLSNVNSDAAGRFAFDVNTPGDFIVMAHDPPGTVSTGALGGASGHASPLSSNRIRVTLEGGEAAAGLVFLYRSTAARAISGRALLDADGDGAVGSGDTPLGNLDVRLLDSSGRLAALTRTLDDGSYFFDTPPAGSYLITTVPSFGLQTRLAVPGPGASAVGSNSILIPDFQPGGGYTDNNFLLGSRGSGPPLPAGPATLEGTVVTQQVGSRRNVPLAGATLLLRDAAGAVRAAGRTEADGYFRFERLPTATYTLAKIDPPGYLAVDAIPGQNGARIDASTMTVRMVAGFNSYAGFQFIDRPGAPVSAQNSILGTVSGDNAGGASPLPGMLVVLQDETDRVVGTVKTGSGGEYAFTNLTTGVYRVTAADAPGASGGDAIPGPHAVKLSSRTIQVTMVGDVAVYAGNNFVETLSLATPGRIQRVLAVGDPIPATGRLGIFSAYPQDQDRDVSAIRRLADDGSVYVADYAGTALLRLGDSAQTAGAAAHGAAGGPTVLQSGAGKSQILLDTRSLDPVDQRGIARVLQVETAPDGTSAILALRADNQRAIYRLDKSGLARLALLPDPADPAELAIAENGQIAFVARDDRGALGLFQTSPAGASATAPTVELLRQGQGVLIGAAIDSFRNLSSNARGDLAILVSLKTANGAGGQAIVRKTSGGLSLAAVSGQRAAPSVSGNSVAPLIALRRPRIGPEGSIVFLGTGDGFTNFYVTGPNRPLRPLHPEADWNSDDTTYDYEVAVDGSVAVRGARGRSSEAGLRLVLPNGAVTQIAPAGARIQPVGRPQFTPSLAKGQLFFLARNLDRPLDPNGHVPVVLCQSPIAGGKPVLDANGAAVVTAVAAPGDPVPGHPALQLLSITQRPTVSAGGVAFGALFGGPRKLAVPSAGLFRVPPGGTLSDGALLAEEGTDLPGADRVALLQVLSYTGDGTLVFGGLLPGAGSIVGTAAAPATTPTAGPKIASTRFAGTRFRIQATPTPAVTPLVTIGQSLDRPDRKLLAVVGRLVAFGSDRQLLVARFTQAGGAIGEGLFLVSRSGPVQAVAVTDDPAPGSGGATFAGFSDSDTFTLNPPAVSNDGNLVFKARLDRGGTETFGVFQWNGTAVTNVGLADPNPDNLALSTQDRAPYALDRWSAGPAGSAYLMETHQTSGATSVTRLFEHSATGLAPLIVPGTTPVQGGSLSLLGDLFDYVLDGKGSVFVNAAAGGAPGLMSLGQFGLAPMVAQGQAIPPIAGADATGRTFDGTFSLLPDSARGGLVFIAGVAKAGDATRRGLFKRNGLGGIDTVMVEGIGVVGARNLSVDTLAASSVRQTVNGTTAAAIRTNGRWQILRSRGVTDSRGVTTFTTVVVTQEGQALPGGAKIVSLDPSALLDLPPNSGPVFTLNEAGDVAFLASDGVHWGVYLFTDAGA